MARPGANECGPSHTLEVKFGREEGGKKRNESAKIIREENERLAADHPPEEATAAESEGEDGDDESDTDIDPTDAPNANAPPTADGSTDRPTN